MASFLDRLLQHWIEPLRDDAAERFATRSG